MKETLEQLIIQAKNEYKWYPVPFGFRMDVVLFEEIDPPVVLLRFYHSQWEKFNEDQRIECGLYLQKVKESFDKRGVPCSLDPVIEDIDSQKV